MTSRSILLVGDSYTNQNLYYKTHFLAPDRFIYLQTPDHAMMITSAMEKERAEKESAVAEVRSFDDFGYVALVQQLNDRDRAFVEMLGGILRDVDVAAAVVEPTFPVAYADHLRAAGIEVIVDRHLFVLERRRKSPTEIEAIAQAQQAAVRAIARVIELLVQSEEHNGVLHLAGIPLTSERLRTETDVFLTRLGMDTSLSPIIAGGPGAADPHWEGHGPIKAHQAIVLDIFPRSRHTRYFGDVTRTVVKGAPEEALRRMFDAVLEAQEAALGRVHAGANGRAVQAAAQEVFAARGFAGEGHGPRFIHSIGHGVGLDIHEPPSIGTTDVELLEGDVVTIEPGLYDPSLGAVRIEDTVAVTLDGYRNLTNFPKNFEV